MRLTGFMLLLAFLFILGFDLFTVLRDGNYSHTVSQWVYQTSKDFMILPFLAGIVAGHFWWPIKGGE